MIQVRLIKNIFYCYLLLLFIVCVLSVHVCMCSHACACSHDVCGHMYVTACVWRLNDNFVLVSFLWVLVLGIDLWFLGHQASVTISLHTELSCYLPTRFYYHKPCFHKCACVLNCMDSFGPNFLASQLLICIDFLRSYHQQLTCSAFSLQDRQFAPENGFILTGSNEVVHSLFPT